MGLAVASMLRYLGERKPSTEAFFSLFFLFSETVTWARVYNSMSSASHFDPIRRTYRGPELEK